jgi:hypothetical protein
MRGFRRALTLFAGAILFAAFIFILASARGFLTDTDSTTPATNSTGAAR